MQPIVSGCDEKGERKGLRVVADDAQPEEGEDGKKDEQKALGV